MRETLDLPCVTSTCRGLVIREGRHLGCSLGCGWKMDREPGYRVSARERYLLKVLRRMS